MGFGEFVQSNIKKSDDSNYSCYSKFEVLTETCLSLPSTGIRDTFYIVYRNIYIVYSIYYFKLQSGSILHDLQDQCLLSAAGKCVLQPHIMVVLGLKLMAMDRVIKHSTTELWSQCYLLCLDFIETFFSSNAFYFQTESHTVQASTEPIMQLRMTLNFWSSCLYFQNTDITGLSLYTQLYVVLGLNSSVLCWQASTVWTLQPSCNMLQWGYLQQESTTGWV